MMLRATLEALRGLTFVCLREGAEDGDLIAEDLGWWPGHSGRVLVDTIDDQLSTAPDVVDGVLEDLNAAGGFYDDIKAVWVILLDLGELRSGITAG